MPTSEVIFKATDTGAGTVKAATENLRRMRMENGQLQKQTKILTTSFSQFGNVANVLGQHQLAGLINQVEHLAVSKVKLTQLLRESKVAMAGLGAAAVAAGYAIGEAIRQYIPWFNEVDNLEKGASVMERINRAANASLALRDPGRASFLAQQQATTAEIAKLENKTGAFGRKIAQTEQEERLIFQLKKLYADRELANEEEKNKTAAQMLRDVNAEKMLLLDEHLGRNVAENERYSKVLEKLEDEKALSTDQRQVLEEEQYRIHQLRLAQIHMDNQDKILAQEKLRRRQMLATHEAYATGAENIFGNLAVTAEAFGKKGFAAFKAFRIAEAIASTYAGAARALADYPWPYSIAVAATVVAAGIANVASIASAKPQAHSGLDYVPQEATYKLQRGEMVLDPGTSEEVRQAARGGAGGGGGNYLVNILLDGDVLARAIGQMSRDGRLTISARGIS